MVAATAAADRVTPAIAVVASVTVEVISTAMVEGPESTPAVTFVLDIVSLRNGVTQIF